MPVFYLPEVSRSMWSGVNGLGVAFRGVAVRATKNRRSENAVNLVCVIVLFE